MFVFLYDTKKVYHFFYLLDNKKLNFTSKLFETPM